jgi:DNA polymerase/3'-5' exonuclease PolX
MSIDKQKLINTFKKLSHIYDTLDEKYRSLVYGTAAYRIKFLTPTQLSDYKYLEKNVKGFGKSIVSKIKELNETGKLKLLDELTTGVFKSIVDLSEVMGIGKKFAQELYKKGIKNKDDLLKAYKNNEVKLNNQQILGLLHYDDLHTKIPRGEISTFLRKLKKIMKKVDDNLIYEILGSYRRHKRLSGDIDLLVTDKDVKTKKDINKNYIDIMVDGLKKHFKHIGDIRKGKTKYSGLFIFKDKVRQIDILFVPYENYFSSLQYFTGSKEFNVMIREKAKDMGYKLNEWGLFKGTKQINLTSEKDIFDILGIEYLEPKDR